MKYITIVYSRINGNIYSYGRHDFTQDLKMYGKFEQEMSVSFECMNIGYNDAIWENMNNFKIDIETKKLIPKVDLLSLINNVE